MTAAARLPLGVLAKMDDLERLVQVPRVVPPQQQGRDHPRPQREQEVAVLLHCKVYLAVPGGRVALTQAGDGGVLLPLFHRCQP